MPVFRKQLIEHPSLYVVALKKSETLPCVLFVHGGPGLNCGVLEYLIEHEGIFDALEYNIVLYDQRGCGRSKPVNGVVNHSDNVDDLEGIYRVLTEKNSFEVAAFAGHSYGAKLVFDYFQSLHVTLPGIFISTAASIITPRVTNLLLDLLYLKKSNPKHYQEILEELEGFGQEKLWELTERTENVFHENADRSYYYWANLSWLEKVKKIQDEIALPMNVEVFTSVRRDLYSKIENQSVNIDEMSTAPHLWINGFSDLVMDGPSAFGKNLDSTILFYKSAHYPHIEEHNRFCGEVNGFLKESCRITNC